MKEKEKDCFVCVRPVVTIEECRRFLNLNADEVPDVEVQEVIDLLINLIEIDYREYIKRRSEAKIISLDNGKDEQKLAA
jgi:hypothetical protein